MTYKTKLTAAGAIKLAAAQAGGPPVSLTTMAVGDGDGAAVPAPTGAETDLVNQVFVDTLSTLEVSSLDASIVIAELIIPADDGGWTIRELGVFDDDGDLFAYGNFPASYKTVPADGATTEMVIRAEIRVANADNVVLTVDPDLVLASRAWVEASYLKKANNLDDVADAATSLANLGGAPLASPVFTGNPTAPTPAPGDDDTSIATTAFIVALLASYATLASPAFTGNPTAPTPAPGDNDTSIATTAFTKAAIDAFAASLGAMSGMGVDTDGTLAANSDAVVPTQKAVKTFVTSAVSGLLDLKGGQACAGNPNYPAASKGDAYYVTSAGKIGGAGGLNVDIGDLFFANADNAGGTHAAVGASWTLLEHNLVGALLSANNLSDVANAATALANLGGAPLASPVFTGNPTAPTPAPGDNDTSVATTAFVVALAAAYATLASPTFTGTVTIPTLDLTARVKSGVTVPAASAIDCAVGNYFTKTAVGALTWTVTNVPGAGAYSFLLELTNGGLGAQTWMGGIKWPGGVAPVLVSAGVDVLGFITDDGGASWRGVHLMRDSK